MHGEVRTAGVGGRALVVALDVLPIVVICALVAALAAVGISASALVVAAVVGVVLALAWVALVRRGYATRGQGPAAAWLGARVLRLADGRSLGSRPTPQPYEVVLEDTVEVPAGDSSWDEWVTPSPAQPSVYPQQIPYEAPGAYRAPAADAGGERPEADWQERSDADGPRPATEGWELLMDDGRTVRIAGLTIVGRRPRPLAHEEADLVQAGGEGRLVSKTHLAIGIDERGPYVTDRGSTNGTAIAHPGGVFEPCPPGDHVRLREGQVVSFGDRRLEIRRTAP